MSFLILAVIPFLRRRDDTPAFVQDLGTTQGKAVLLTVATALLDELQVALAVISAVVPLE